VPSRLSEKGKRLNKLESLPYTIAPPSLEIDVWMREGFYLGNFTKIKSNADLALIFVEQAALEIIRWLVE